MKICRTCNIEKSELEFHKKSRRKDGVILHCIDCTNAKEKLRRDRFRKIVLEKYGNKCACCGEFQSQFLSIDHVNGGGTAERKRIGPGALIQRLANNPVSSEYQILCYNCNMSQGFNGYCHSK